MPDLSALSATPDAGFEVWREQVSISGEAFRRKEVLGFADAVAKATEAEAEFGVRLEPDADNTAESLRVVGYTRAKLIPGEATFQIGFLNADLISEMSIFGPPERAFAAKLRAIEFASEHADSEDPIDIVIDLYRALELA